MKEKGIFKGYKGLSLTILASSILFSNQIYALQQMDENELRAIDGQDGISMDIGFSALEIDNLKWEDKTGSANNIEKELSFVANKVKIDKNMSYLNGNYNLGILTEIQSGADSSGKTGIDLGFTLRPSTISVAGFKICEGAVCDPEIGRLGIQMGTALKLGLVTTDGLFNKHAQSILELGIKNTNIYIGLPIQANSPIHNQLILKNFNFNFYGKGVAYIDDIEGFVMHTNVGGESAAKANRTNTTPSSTYGYVDLKRVDLPDSQQTPLAYTSTYSYEATPGVQRATSAGLNIELMTKQSQLTDDPTTHSLAAASGLIRVGASGRIVNGFLQLRGTNAKDLTANQSVMGYVSDASGLTNTSPNTVTGTNKSVIGSTGIAMRVKGEFTREGDSMLDTPSNATKLEIGGAGNNTFGFEFSELSPLFSNSLQRAHFDSGNVYLNLASTQHLALPKNEALNTSRFGGVTGQFLTTDNDYIQQIHENTAAQGNPKSIVVGIRGAEFQAISKRGRFTSSHDVKTPSNVIAPSSGVTNEWGLGLPFYNLNSNIAIYSTQYPVGKKIYTLDSNNNISFINLTQPSQRLGFGMSINVQGRDETGTKTTSIVVVDARNDMYIGLRNIDMLLRGYGSIGMENAQVNVDLPNLLMVMSAQLAGGYFPKYINNAASAATLNTASNILNPFNSNNDVLMGLKLKLLGDMNFSLIPKNEIGLYGNRLAIVGRYDIRKNGGSTIQIVDPIDESMIGLDDIEGMIEFNNAIVINKDNVGFNYGFNINPDKVPDKVLRVKNLNFYPRQATPTAPLLPAQRVGEVVMTGGRFNMNMNITPRN